MSVKTAIVIQARLGSSRLPAKVLLPLPTGRTVIQEIVLRMTDMRARNSDAIEGVYLAVPDKDAPFFASHFETGRFGVTIVKGGELNVLSRFVEVERFLPGDVGSIMRITGDCPLINPDVCLRVLAAFHEGNADYCSNVLNPRTFTRGLDCEVFKRDMLYRAAGETPSPAMIEHVTPSMADVSRFEVVQVSSERPGFYLQDNYSLDTIEDYRRIYRHFVMHGGILDG
jgi:spore coat polysaccharide biosynthesis protein SpsF (cytidylyltransferase family)